jgi:enoyl-CoA hydratase/carnithine racemase
VQLARRWTGPDAVEGGLAEEALPLDKLLDHAIARGAELARLGANRKVYGRMKEAIYGENAAINNIHGPAHMLKNMEQFH